MAIINRNGIVILRQGVRVRGFLEKNGKRAIWVGDSIVVIGKDSLQQLKVRLLNYVDDVDVSTDATDIVIKD